MREPVVLVVVIPNRKLTRVLTKVCFRAPDDGVPFAFREVADRVDVLLSLVTPNLVRKGINVDALLVLQGSKGPGLPLSKCTLSLVNHVE